MPQPDLIRLVDLFRTVRHHHGGGPRRVGGRISHRDGQAWKERGAPIWPGRPCRLAADAGLAGGTGAGRLVGLVRESGLREMDAFIADPWIVRPGSDGAFCERVVRIPGSFLCLTPLAFDLPIGLMPAQRGNPLCPARHPGCAPVAATGS